MVPKWCSSKELACQCRRCKRHGFDTWVGKIIWSRKWQPTPVFLPGKSHRQRSLEGHSPRGHKESGMTEDAYIDLYIDIYINKDIENLALICCSS